MDIPVTLAFTRGEKGISGEILVRSWRKWSKTSFLSRGRGPYNRRQCHVNMGATMRFAGLGSVFLMVCHATLAVGDTPLSTKAQGGWEYQRWLTLATACAERILDTVPDRYGPVNTPLWLGIVDPSTEGLLLNKPPNWQLDWDAEDYVMTAHGCNLYRDMPTLKTLYALSRLTGHERYKTAADAYLTFYLEEMPSKTTGLFPWGEHMSYNLVRDRITATRHEMERNLPEWEMLWRINPEAVTREIEAIRRISIYDDETYLFDRHANYYTGEFDPLPVRGAYIKHSGLFAHAFMFLYSKTKNEKHLEWARQIADLYWRHRNPTTNLVPGHVTSSGGSGPCSTQMMLAYYLLRALAYHDDPYIGERAMGMVDSFIAYGYDAEKGAFAGGLDPATGAVVQPGPNLWNLGESADVYRVLACLEAWRRTGGAPHYREPALRVLRHLSFSEPDGDVNPELAALWLEAYLDAFELTEDVQLLQGARALAEWTATHLVRDGYILESAHGYVYQAKSRPGALLDAWLRLYEIESRQPFHWTAPDSVVPGAMLLVQTRGIQRDAAVILDWVAPSGARGTLSGKYEDDATRFMLPIDVSMGQGYLALRFSDAAGRSLGEGRVLVAENPDGPTIGAWELPPWAESSREFAGRIHVHDPSGVESVRIHYQVGTQPAKDVMAKAVGDDWYAFTLPTSSISSPETLTLWAEVKGNPAFPISAVSATQKVAFAQCLEERLADLAESKLTGIPGSNLGVRVRSAHQVQEGWLRLARLSSNPESSDGLPKRILGEYWSVETDLPESKDLALDFAFRIDTSTALELLSSSIAAYRWRGDSWRRVETQTFDATNGELNFTTSEGGLIVVAGEGRQKWRRTFNGALLSSPAAARLSSDGRLAIILDTRASDGMLYALDGHGETLWTYDVDAPQPFVAVADLDKDGLDEIAVGGRDLALLGPDGAVRWKAGLDGVGAPILADLGGDGTLEVIAATFDGALVAYASTGEALWKTDALGTSLAIPTSGTSKATGQVYVAIGGDGYCVAVSSTGKVQWKAPIPGKAMYGPASADVNQDGWDDIVVFSRDDAHGMVTALSGADGTLLWDYAVSREGDWSPVVVKMSAKEELQVVVQGAEGVNLHFVDATTGRLTRRMPIESRTTTTPVALDLTGDGLLDLLIACNESRRVWAIDHDGRTLWTHTPPSVNLGGTKIKGGGSLLVADIDGDGMLDIVGGDDETWLNAVATETPCAPWAVWSGQYHGDPGHRGFYRGWPGE